VDDCAYNAIPELAPELTQILTCFSSYSKVSKIPKSQAKLPLFIKSHFSTLMYLIKSLPATTNASDEESDASTLLLTAVSESTKLLPWVMDNKKQLKAYLKVSHPLFVSRIWILNILPVRSAST
jgi:hypothetical protein